MTLSETYFHPTNIHGDVIRLPSHRALQWLVDPSYERERIRTMKQVIQPDHVVFDIGAEQGDISALIASWVPDGGMVLVEPNPRVWPCIKATFNENALKTPKYWFRGFCGSSGETNRHTDTAWPIESVGTIQPAAGFLSLVEDTAPVTTLDHLVSSSGQAPNVITIDVEGGEVEVLLGAGQTLNDYRPEVFVSVHPSFLRGFGKTMHDVFVVFEQHEYRWSVLESDHEIHVWATPRR